MTTVGPPAGLDLDAIRQLLDDLARSVPNGPNALWEIRHNHDRAIGRARQLLAEVARLRQELDEAKAEVGRYRELHESLWPVLDAARVMRQRYVPKVGPQNEALFQPEELALIRAVDNSTVGSRWDDGRLANVAGGVWSRLALAENERDRALAAFESLEATTATAITELQVARHDADRMRDVVAKAETLVDDWRMGRTTHGGGLSAAVDAYRSAAPPPLDPDVRAVVDDTVRQREQQRDEMRGGER